MLTARGEVTLGSARMRLLEFFEREFRVHCVSRTGLIYDSKFAVPSTSTTGIHVYVFPHGNIDIDGVPHRGPVAFVAASTELEGGAAGTSRIRSSGSPLQLIDLRLQPGHVLAPVGVRRGPVPLSERTWDAARRLADLTETGGDGVEQRLRELMESLEADAIITPAARLSIRRVEEARFRRLHSAVVPSFATIDVSVTASKLLDLINISERQLVRDVRQLTDDFGMIGRGLRDVLRRLRLRTAIMFLSTRDFTITEVAYKMGYSDTHAMARAFRDAALPPPADVRRALHEHAGE